MRVWHVGGVPIKAFVDHIGGIEQAAFEQLVACAQLPFIHRHIAVMPDVHLGYGATVGSVLPMRGAVVPSAVGVDIGCGMVAQRLEMTANELPDHLGLVRHAIEQMVPHGRTKNGGPGDVGAWSEVPAPVAKLWIELLLDRWMKIVEKRPVLSRGNLVNHLGTLGTGNHFIEVCLDEDDRVWIMLHSGSRGVGARLGQHFIGLAKERCEQWFATPPARDLGWLPEGTPEFADYMEAAQWAQDFAAVNREIMLLNVWQAVCDAMGRHIPRADETAVNCHHNYVARECHFGTNVWVTRKGAVRAREGDLGIIPGSMGARSYIVRGKGNVEAFHSCSHGAGRAMSRTEAKRTFGTEDLVAQTAHVECRKDEGVVDEIPGAYKNIDAVMASQRDLVDVVHTFRQVVCVKG